MYKFICPNCNEENIVNDKKALTECSFCWQPVPDNIEFISNSESTDILGLTLVYQKTMQKIKVAKTNKLTFGREGLGQEIFSSILVNGAPVVSRKHFSIEYRDNNFYLIDENSLNGTFYSDTKINCKLNPQIIVDNSIIYVGKEMFVAYYDYSLTEEKVNSSVETTQENIRRIKCYKCNDENCSGYESPNQFDICPNCGAWKKSIIIYQN